MDKMEEVINNIHLSAYSKEIAQAILNRINKGE